MGDWHTASSGNTQDDHRVDSLSFTSRRSPFLCRHACVATSQPLASSIGLDFLRRGANAADTAVAVAAALAVLEPCSTGLGGDMFCLYYQSGRVTAINGSGNSPQQLTLDLVQRDCPGRDDDLGGISSEKFQFSAHAVTVPGAARGWEDLLLQHGSGNFSMADLLEPAAQLADEGFPVAPITSHHWETGMPLIQKWVAPGDTLPMTVDGTHAPKPGQIFRNPHMAKVLRDLGNKGATEGFYQGDTGRAIVEAVQKHGGVMTLQDLASHASLFPNPMKAEYRGVNLWQVPPNGQGVAALVALTGLQHLESLGLCPNISPDTIGSADALHVQIEMMRLGFKDAREHVCCPNHQRVTDEWLLDPVRIGSRAEALFNPDEAVIRGEPIPSSCTVSFQVVDQEGNAISFVNSNYMGFGTGIVPEGCGFTLQNRGFGFCFDPEHPNMLAGGKRPCHTIIPGMLTHADTDELYATLSNMGGNMQPQGHLQLTVDLVAGNVDPQTAVDMPRFCIASGTQDGAVLLEDGVPDDIAMELESRGHQLKARVSGHSRSVFGRAQIIKRDRASGVLWAGSDGRADGCAMGF